MSDQLKLDDLEEGKAFLSRDQDQDEEKAILADEVPTVVAKERVGLGKRIVIWMIINTLATIGIVFTNKKLFENDSLKNDQVTFAAFHFTITGVTMFMISRPQIGIFEPKRVKVMDVLPLAAAMCLNVILPNFSLAYSTITFYQIARILLTPIVALLNYLITRATIPRAAALTLIPVCIGVGIVSYFDTKDVANTSTKTTSSLGVFFGLAGVLCSSLYTVWVATYHKKLHVSSMQLLANQAPVGAGLLYLVIPFSDNVSVLGGLTSSTWTLILMSGCFACMVNLSQFYIINEAGPVSSTVVGHLKTCCIVGLGWILSARPIGDGSLIGIVLAVGGMIWYSVIMHRS